MATSMEKVNIRVDGTVAECPKGTTLVVDVGGKSLRICSVELYRDTTFRALKSGTVILHGLIVAARVIGLFIFIAEQIKAFLETYYEDHLQTCRDSEYLQPFSLGFTFSFPAYQAGIYSGILLHWTKGFRIVAVVGKDVCRLLQHEIDILNLPVRITALVNDADGAIMSRVYNLPASETRTIIGAIFGTGTNCVYPEKLSEITKALEGEYDGSTGNMFISTKWGSFDNQLLVLSNTIYDTKIDESSLNPANQMFEKRVSGMFLGELLRIAAFNKHTNPSIGLFCNSSAELAAIVIPEQSPLYMRWAVDSSIHSATETDNSIDLKPLTDKIHQLLGVPTVRIGVEDAQGLKPVSHAIGKRAARQAGMAVRAVILQSRQLISHLGPSAVSPAALSHEDKNVAVDIGVDGSVAEHYPGFDTYMREALRVIDGIGFAGEKRIRIARATDGSSVGAAIIAFLAAKDAGISASST